MPSSSSHLSYGFGGGLLWDITNDWFVKAEYRGTLFTLEDFENYQLFNTVRPGVGFNF